MIKLNKSEGFSLVELMIVVAIMAILAAIAIPTYLSFQMKAREAEARTNLAAIKTCEESYKAENDAYVDCGATPVAVPGSTPDAWAGGGIADFTAIGFNPAGAVRYQYEVGGTTASTATAFEASATGDLDANATNAVFAVTQATNVSKTSASNVY